MTPPVDRDLKRGMLTLPKINIRSLLKYPNTTKVFYFQIGKVDDPNMVLLKFVVKRIQA